MKPRAIFFILLLLFGSTIKTTQALSAGQQRRVGNSVARAIEMTKRRQAFDNVMSASDDSSAAASSAAATPAGKRSKSNQRPVRTEKLDVSRLNQLIKTIDKTWIMPRTGSREPIGSNFQAYKKTCANIYKGRSGACQQIGFGVMCFNYCFEQGRNSFGFGHIADSGEELKFKCQDISEPSYCRSNANYDTFFTKHKKDSYKVKAFIHQMISRCYATAICNSQAIFNTTILTKSGNGSLKLSKDLSTPMVMQPGMQQSSRLNSALKARGGADQRTNKQTIWDRYAVSSRQENQLPPLQPNAGIIGFGKHTALKHRQLSGPPIPENEFEGQPKYVPFWQRLLKRKNSTSSAATARQSFLKTTTIESTKIGTEDLSMEEEEANIKDKAEEMLLEEDQENLAAEEEEDEKEMMIAVATTTQPTTTTTKRPKRRRLKPVRMTSKVTTTSTTLPKLPYDLIDDEDEEYSDGQAKRFTWKPLQAKSVSTTLSPCVLQSRSAAKSDNVPATQNQDAAAPLEGFWSKFQPGRWFQSLHYITNTG